MRLILCGSASRRGRSIVISALVVAGTLAAATASARAQPRTPSVTAGPTDGSSLAPASSPATASPAPVAPARPRIYLTPARPPDATEPASDISRRDIALTLLGNWKCATISNLQVTESYGRSGRDEIDLRNTIRDENGHVYTLAQQFQYDPKAAQWSTNLQQGQFVGTAGRWLDADQQWVFEGKLHNTQGPVRMLYTNLGPAAFRRDFQAKNNGRWQTLDLETCKRTSGR